MKKLLSLSVMALLVLSVMPVVMAAGIGAGFGGDIIVEEFKPIVWQCDDRILTEDYYQPWRTTDCESECKNVDQCGKVCQEKSEECDLCMQECLITCEELDERAGNYLFEGEKYQIDVVVFDKNKIDTVDAELILNDGEYTINCVKIEACDLDCFAECNARIDEETITEFDETTMQAFRCTLTAFDSEHMPGDLYDLTVEACDNDDQGGQCSTYDEISPIFINPLIMLGVDGDLDFSDVRPGTSSYSQIILENEAEGGVLLDMFITGKNWPATDTDMGRCYDPHTKDLENYLSLGAFSYYAENGAYSTRDDKQKDSNYGLVTRGKDAEGYVNINYQMETGFTTEMFDDAEILQAGGNVVGNKGYRANVLSPGGVMALTFRLDLPEPCYGEFESQQDGSLFIWAEAI
jgi:hypothetical protein